ncbi:MULTISPECIES: DUF397 domain-containing protein [Streptomyces]|uniref:DUF397 domain-containing protein n=1 Tax=Streptomyces mirabilis TaxID=68239 RepID=A0ABU3URC0_9ACTN|nr:MULTISPECIES: DUF397 domain-containing protein [Streptomyces]MCX4609900.1 DUF397 domain-containing protein [Streptomyces mirabilis]MDU8996472.1 DUF397 domain-containing protein [Streptomyces mirabilis]QDN78822.1 DUF397 domain-containing protein [Streptomyces sp. S1A1-7]
MRNFPDYDLSTAIWHKSSYSGGGGDNCLEVASGHPTLIPVRDSKNPLGPTLTFRAEAWTAFVAELKR